ncbi:MAG: NifU N-terminal domain-containing protein [Myxococcota bacterium]|nr:NifU N-terminal domain-containing protein [Myxococcota bacterium]
MLLSILKFPFRAARKIVRTATGSSAPAPEPAPAPRPMPAEPPAWMREEQEHSHDHGHDHGHSHDHAPAPEAEAAPAPAPAGGVDVYPEDTPNPNAYKFTVSARVTDKAFSASTAEEAGTDLARALIAIEGVASIFGVNDFVTVTKDGGASWSTVIPAVTAALKTHITA